MKIEIKYREFYLNFKKNELEKMAIAMKDQLSQYNHHVSLDVCLDILSKQVGFNSYKELANKFEDLDYEYNKSLLINEWVEVFLTLGFDGWEITTVEIEDYGSVFSYNVLGHAGNNSDDKDIMYENIWRTLSELIFLEANLHSTEHLPYIDKYQLEKYLLKETSPDSVVMKKILENIHNHILTLPEENKIALAINTIYYYLEPEIENKVLYSGL